MWKQKIENDLDNGKCIGGYIFIGRDGDKQMNKVSFFLKKKKTLFVGPFAFQYSIS